MEIPKYFMYENSTLHKDERLIPGDFLLASCYLAVLELSFLPIAPHFFLLLSTLAGVSTQNLLGGLPAHLILCSEQHLSFRQGYFAKEMLLENGYGSGSVHSQSGDGTDR